MTHLSLAEQFRPKTFEDFVGQSKIFHENHFLRTSMKKETPISLLLWGPPGTGKTSFARVYIRSFNKSSYDMHPSTFSAQRIKEVLAQSKSTPLFRPTIFWIDEIHRLTTPQQDLLLKALEDGDIVVVGATTENPSFCLRPALLSRMNSLRFMPLEEKDLMKLLERIIGTLGTFSIEDEARRLLSRMASGDARKLVSYLDVLSMHPKKESPFKVEDVKHLLDAPGGIASSGEGRYLLISALHKAVRGSDCNAALYWFSRLVEAQEDLRYIARRLIRMATEDIGLADPTALPLAVQAAQAYQMLGSPEGDLALAEVVMYLALSPKSASCYVAFGEAKEAAQRTRHLPPPSHIINAPTKWMEKEGFGEGYIWEHDIPDCVSYQSFWPEQMDGQSFYSPVKRGFERQLEERFLYFERLRAKKKKEHESGG